MCRYVLRVATSYAYSVQYVINIPTIILFVVHTVHAIFSYRNYIYILSLPSTRALSRFAVYLSYFDTFKNNRPSRFSIRYLDT